MRDSKIKGVKELSSEDARSKDVMGLLDLMSRAVGNYIEHSEHPAIAVQDAAVAAAHLAGMFYGKLAATGVIEPPIEDLLKVNNHNFSTGFQYGFAEAARSMIDTMREKLVD